MTDYTELKRSLQKLGFNLEKRFRFGDVLLTNGEYRIRFWVNRYHNADGKEIEDPNDVTYYAVTKCGFPVSWHFAGKNICVPEKWTGQNFHIVKTDAEGIDLEIAKTLYMANAAQYCHQRINIEQERLA